MSIAKSCRIGILIQIVAYQVMTYSIHAFAQEPSDVETIESVLEGPSAAFAFEKSFRDPDLYRNSKPVRLDQCENITALTTDLWSKKDVLTDFKQYRTEDQVGAIVIVKTEYCCDGSRLCAVTTACMEKKSTPLVGRFRVYAGWIKNNPDRAWSQWDDNVIREYEFIQGPGARVVVMVPTWDGKMYQWHSTATRLDLSASDFDRHQGETPKLEAFLEEAVKYAPTTKPDPDPETIDSDGDE
ncbi:MAG: hypothetical protein H8E66_08640 [Planctomycetes bacterium]|nr:hypothetical protein [Planctomycetota bacterium]